MQEISFTFNVTFDKDRSLAYGKHHVMSHVYIYYYKDYQENQNGDVISKGVAYTEPLITMHFEVEVPGKFILFGVTNNII